MEAGKPGYGRTTFVDELGVAGLKHRLVPRQLWVYSPVMRTGHHAERDRRWQDAQVGRIDLQRGRRRACRKALDRSPRRALADKAALCRCKLLLKDDGMRMVALAGFIRIASIEEPPKPRKSAIPASAGDPYENRTRVFAVRGRISIL